MFFLPTGETGLMKTPVALLLLLGRNQVSTRRFTIMNQLRTPFLIVSELLFLKKTPNRRLKYFPLFLMGMQLARPCTGYWRSR